MLTLFSSKPVSTLQLAWAAGFIEGEGSFSNTVTAAQVQKEPIERLHALFGGRIYQRQNKRLQHQANLDLGFNCGTFYPSNDDSLCFNVTTKTATN